MPARFKMRVFPACSWIPAPVSNVVPMTLCKGRARCGRDKMYMSSKNRSKCSPGVMLFLACRHALWTPSGSPLLATFSLPDVVADPSSSFPQVCCGLAECKSCEWQESLECRDFQQLGKRRAPIHMIVTSHSVKQTDSTILANCRARHLAHEPPESHASCDSSDHSSLVSAMLSWWPTLAHRGRNCSSG